MKLHWSPRSPYVRKVMICAHELGLVDRIETVRSVVAMQAPNQDLMRDNPLAKIPALVLDDGSTLVDSVVICEYLNALAEGPLFPQQGPQKWQVLRWHALADGLLDVLVLWRNERDEREPLSPLVDAFAAKTRAALALFEQESGPLAQAPLSIGTITVGCALGYLDYRFASYDWRAAAPRLAHWHHQMEMRPSFNVTHPLAPSRGAGNAAMPSP